MDLGDTVEAAVEFTQTRPRDGSLFKGEQLLERIEGVVYNDPFESGAACADVDDERRLAELKL